MAESLSSISATRREDAKALSHKANLIIRKHPHVDNKTTEPTGIVALCLFGTQASRLKRKIMDELARPPKRRAAKRSGLAGTQNKSTH